MYDYNPYLEAISENLSKSPDQWSFKSDWRYKGILEHVSPEIGEEYLKYIQEEFHDIYVENRKYLIEMCYENDKYGNTNKHKFQDFCECSPTNLRYIYHTFLNLEYMSKLEYNEVDIIEIGGGYGGLCFFMNRLSTLFKIKIKSYHIFDLGPAQELQKRYLNLLNVTNYSASTLYDVFYINQNSYLISNYAFSELSMDIQKEYIDKVIAKYASNGMLVWNTIEPYKFIDKNIIIERERPITSLGDCIKNCFVYF